MAVLQHPSNAEDIPNFSCVCVSESRSFYDVIMARLSNAVANGLAAIIHIQLLIYSVVFISVSAVLSSDKFDVWSTEVLYFIGQSLKSLCSFSLCPLLMNQNLFQSDAGNGLPTTVVLSPQTTPPRSGPGVRIQGNSRNFQKPIGFSAFSFFTFKNTQSLVFKRRMQCAISHDRSLPQDELLLGNCLLFSWQSSQYLDSSFI